jgi:hypothetical protein
METWAAAEQCAVLDYRQSPFAATARHKSPKPLKRLERVNGIEPSSSAWKADAIVFIGFPVVLRACPQVSEMP